MKPMPSFFQNLFKKDSDEPAVAVADDHEADAAQPNSLLSAMNLPSPFAVSAEEQFTVRELSMLMPPQFVRHDAMPGDQPVPLPLDVLRASLQQGRPALRLSQIYQTCPILFARQVLPSEDVEIVLPFQKVKRMVETGSGNGTDASVSPFATVSPPPQSPAARMDSPFAASGSPFATSGGQAQTAGTSPFAAARATMDSPFAVRTADKADCAEVLSPAPSEPLVPGDSAPPFNPFLRLDAPPPVPPRPAQSPFQLVATAAPPAPAEPAAEAPLPSPSTTPVLPLTPSSPFPHASGQGNGNGHGTPRGDEVPNAGENTSPAGPDNTLPSLPPTPQFGLPAAAPAPMPARPQTAPTPELPVLPARLAPPLPPAREPSQRLKVSLASLLRDVTAEDLGFDPSAVPGNIDADLSYDTILPQLATGRVEVSIEELRLGVVERFRPAFARVRPGVRFLVPLSEIFRSLPSSAIPAPQPGEHVAISTTAFQTPFAIKAGEDQTRASLPSLSQMITPAAAEPAPLAPFPIAPPLASPGPQTSPVSLPQLMPAPADPPSAVPAAFVPPTLTGLPPLPKLANIPGMSAIPSPFARPPGMQPPPATAGLPVLPPMMAPPATMPSLPAAESHEDLGHPFSASSLRFEPPVTGAQPVPAPAEPFNPAKLFTEAALPPLTPPPVIAAPQPAPAPAPLEPAVRMLSPAPAGLSAPPVEFNFGESIDYTQTLLRAFFFVTGDLTPHQIVDHCSQIPGLRSCLAIVSGNVIASGHDSTSEDISRFTANAPRAFEFLTGLAESMSFEGNGSFTLRAGASERTFFIESGICLAVLHEKPGFAPGVREKLILTARALAEMMD